MPRNGDLVYIMGKTMYLIRDTDDGFYEMFANQSDANRTAKQRADSSGKQYEVCKIVPVSLYKPRIYGSVQ